MFSFLHLLYTGDFKADGWVLITVETEVLYFYLMPQLNLTESIL